MALLEKLSESCQRKKINAWLGSPGDWDPTPHRHRRHQSHSLTHFRLIIPNTVNNGTSRANKRRSNGNQSQCHVTWPSTLFSAIPHWYCVIQLKDISFLWGLTIPPFVFPSWPDTPGMAGCQFDIGITVWSRFYKHLEASALILKTTNNRNQKITCPFKFWSWSAVMCTELP